MKVKGDKKLFREAEEIANNFEPLRAIVQNDAEITEEELNDFIANIDEITEDIYHWGSKVVGYIVNYNKEG